MHEIGYCSHHSNLKTLQNFARSYERKNTVKNLCSVKPREDTNLMVKSSHSLMCPSDTLEIGVSL